MATFRPRQRTVIGAEPFRQKCIPLAYLFTTTPQISTRSQGRVPTQTGLLKVMSDPLAKEVTVLHMDTYIICQADALFSKAVYLT